MYDSVAISAAVIAAIAALFLFLWFLPRPNLRGDVVVAVSALAACVSAYASGASPSDLGFKPVTSPLRLLAEVVGLVLATYIVKGLLVDGLAIRLLGVPEPPVEADAGRYRNRRRLLAELWTSAYASPLEEVLFRGFLQTAMTFVALHLLPPLVAVPVAVLLPALLFGIAHRAQGLAGVLAATTVGLVFGAWFAANGHDLVPLLLAHTLINGVTCVLLYVVPAERLRQPA